ncbi:BH0509 family protein [Salibacterium aidingense]|nr:BH0509 family protein [Salibacterium aidingense]
MLKRQERKNMISFLAQMRGEEAHYLSILTDEEVEHLYEKTYFETQITE